MSDREAFEKWAATEFDNIRRDGSSYESMMVAGAYIGWQAAQAQAGDGEPYGWVSEHTNGITYFDKAYNEIYLDTALSITPLYTAPPAAKVNQQLLEAIKVCASFLIDFGLENSDAYQQALSAIAAAQEQLLDGQVHLVSILNGNIWHTSDLEKIKLPVGFELKLYASKAAIAAAQEIGK